MKLKLSSFPASSVFLITALFFLALISGIIQKQAYAADSGGQVTGASLTGADPSEGSWECTGEAGHNTTLVPQGRTFWLKCGEDKSLNAKATAKFTCICVKPEFCKDSSGVKKPPIEKSVELPCTDIEVCGDGETQKGEECDDGDRVSNDGCDANCKIEECGDNIIQGGIGETCDDGNVLNNDGCSSTCLVEVCGDNITQTIEQCDDGNVDSGDGCSALCKTEFCGDGTTQGGMGESCDDGNVVNNDGCTSACKVEGCGDGNLQLSLGEECDDGNITTNDGCSDACKLEKCGDNIVQANEECDEKSATCSACKWTVCQGTTSLNCVKVGPNICKAYDECIFNGQMVSSKPGDDSKCKNNPACHDAVCGDNKLEGTEQCDDGNLNSGDGCTSTCVKESCGDGVIQAALGEACDDGNTSNGDACSSTCQTETCSLDCNTVIAQGTKDEFTINCSTSNDTTNASWDFVNIQNIKTGVQNTGNGTGTGTCGPTSGMTSVKAILTLADGVTSCNTIENFTCDICTTFVENAADIASADAGLGCRPEPGWTCGLNQNTPNVGWDQRGTVCYCPPASCTFNTTS